MSRVRVPFPAPVRLAVAVRHRADVAQLVERILGKDEVTGSTPVIGSSNRPSVRSESVSLNIPDLRELLEAALSGGIACCYHAEGSRHPRVRGLQSP